MIPTIVRRNNGTSNMPAKTFSSWVDQLLQNNLNSFLNDDNWAFSASDAHGTVPVNLKETGNTYELELIAPGLKKEDFKLNVSNDLLTVSFEQKEEQQEENQAEGWLRKEFRQQSFSRSFNLGDSVDVNKINAVYNNGILNMTLPKKENAQRLSKTIQVS